MIYFIDSRRGRIYSAGEKVYICSRLSTAESEAVTDGKLLTSQLTRLKLAEGLTRVTVFITWSRSFYTVKINLTDFFYITIKFKRSLHLIFKRKI